AGRPYLDVHLDAHRGVARILTHLRLLRVSAEEAVDREGRLRRLFRGNDWTGEELLAELKAAAGD
ncbi:MAG TPA: hypothetical protein VGB87_03910, partial [Vicinamibacteria bacterium]